VQPTASSTPAPCRSSDEGTGFPSPGGLAGHVRHLGRAVVDDRADDHGHPVEVVDARPHLQVLGLGDAGDDVPVRREVRGIDGDGTAVGPEGERGVDELEEVHRDRVVDDDLVIVDPEQRGDGRPCGERQIHPPGVPRPDQPTGPLLGHDPLDRLHGPAGRPAQRVAVEVDEVRVRHDELVPPAGQGVTGVERRGVVPRDHGRSLTYCHRPS